MIKVASLFSGIGGFERGFQQASDSIDIIFSSEIDKYARQIYKKNFGVEPYGDITQINAAEIPDHDILCGGFPCQAFSVAGKRRGFEDTRGTLFFEIMRITEAKRPKLLFLENVKGLLSHDKGRTFQTILRSMDELGYDAEWQVFNSKNHGVPQNRERVFIIGHLRGSGSRQIFPITGSNGTADSPDPTVHCLDANCSKGSAQQARTAICAPVLTPDRETKRQAGRRFKNNGEPAFTVTAQDRHGIVIGHNDGVATRAPLKFLTRNQKNYEVGDYSFTIDSCNTGGVKVDDEIRRLTPLECERLQGFADGWTEGISDTQRYKCLGNAVTVNVIEFIARHIITTIFGDD